MLEHCNNEGIKTVDNSVDLSRKENTNLPYDSHPSATANMQYAQKLYSFLNAGPISDQKSALKEDS